MKRLFVAIDPSSEALEQIESYRKKLTEHVSDAGARIKWTRPEQAHMTLKFIGDTDPDDVDRIRQTLRGALADAADATELVLESLGVFPNPASPRVLWLGPDGESRKQLRSLHEAIDTALAGLDIERDRRKYVPHLTIGRVKSKSNESWAPLIDRAPPVEITAGSIAPVVLYESKLDHRGATHIELDKFELR